MDKYTLNKYEYNKLISIVTPAYNTGSLIRETIDSVLAQTYPYWEMIIIDDASSDETCEIIRTYQKNDERIHLIHLEKNQGVANSRNIGLQEAKGRYIAFLDSDDIWLEQKLERQLMFMKNKDIGFSFTQYRQFKESIQQYRKAVDIPQEVDYCSLLKSNVIGCLTVMIDREKIQGFYMIKQRHEDYIAWLSILKKGFKAYGLQEDLARYRISNNSISANKKRSALWTWNIYRNIEQLPVSKSIYYFVHYFIQAIKKHYF